MTGVDHSKLHEIETVSLVLGRRVAVKDLSQAFLERGFTEVDDFFTLSRTDACPAWQIDSIITAQFLLSSEQVDLDSSCDSIRFDYLLASLPSDFIPVFIGAIRGFAESFGGELRHRNERVYADRLLELFGSYVRDIDAEVAEQPGSELLAILIEQSYPRR